MSIQNSIYFQHDGAPAHRCAKVKSCFFSQPFQLLEGWPGNSADLNPIENLWAFLKKKIAEMKPTPHQSLVDAIRSVWATEITASYCEKLISSMPRRVAACLKKQRKMDKVLTFEYLFLFACEKIKENIVLVCHTVVK